MAAASASPWITSPFDEELGIAAGGEDDRHRPVVGELRVGASKAAGLTRRQTELDQVGAQPRQHRLRLGIAEATVELEHLRPVRGDHQARVEHPVVRRFRAGASGRRSAGGRRRRSPRCGHDRTPEPASSCPCHPCSARDRRRRSACSPGPGASGTTFSPSQSASSDSSSPSRCSSSTTSVSPNRRSTKKTSTASRASASRRRDDHALPGGQPVRLQDRRIGGAGEVLERLLVGAEHRVSGGGHRRRRHQLLGVDLRALDPRRFGPGPKAAIPAASRASTSPATSGASGPTTTRSTPSAAAAETIPRTSSAPTSRQRASAAMPALPGAHSSSGAPPERASARTIACSRPPPPTTRTLISIVSASPGIRDLAELALTAPW